MAGTLDTTTRITHVIFDVDGLILDTERVYSECCGEICQEYGHTFTWDIKSRMLGKKEVESAQILIDALNLPLTVEEYHEKFRVKFAEKVPHAEVMPGVEKLIRHLHKHKVPLALATGSDSWSYTQKTASHEELFDLFLHAVLSGDDPEVKHGKPAPDCFLVCGGRFVDNPKPEKVLVFEDAANGAEAALAAGMKVVWVPDSRADRSQLQGRAHQILDSIEEFKPQDFGLPPYESS